MHKSSFLFFLFFRFATIFAYRRGARDSRTISRAARTTLKRTNEGGGKLRQEDARLPWKKDVTGPMILPRRGGETTLLDLSFQTLRAFCLGRTCLSSPVPLRRRSSLSLSLSVRSLPSVTGDRGDTLPGRWSPRERASRAIDRRTLSAGNSKRRSLLLGSTWNLNLLTDKDNIYRTTVYWGIKDPCAQIHDDLNRFKGSVHLTLIDRRWPSFVLHFPSRIYLWIK